MEGKEKAEESKKEIKTFAKKKPHFPKPDQFLKDEDSNKS